MNIEGTGEKNKYYKIIKVFSITYVIATFLFFALINIIVYGNTSENSAPSLIINGVQLYVWLLMLSYIVLLAVSFIYVFRKNGSMFGRKKTVIGETAKGKFPTIPFFAAMFCFFIFMAFMQKVLGV
jgi:hypothetical protein